MDTLADRIARDGPLNELDAVGWIIRLARRVEEMHARGLVHGRISPACLSIEAPERSALGMLVEPAALATDVACHSPERLTGAGASVTDDTWALAVTLYTALTGSPPFAGVTEDDLRNKILGSSPPPLAVFDVGDDDLQRILDDALARERERRTASLEALRLKLVGWHPDPSVARLPPVDESNLPTAPSLPIVPEIADEPTTDLGAPPKIPSVGGADSASWRSVSLDEDEDERTMVRQAPAMLGAVASSAFAPYVAPRPPEPERADLPKPLPAAGRPAEAPAPDASAAAPPGLAGMVRTEPLLAVSALAMSPPLDDEDEDDIRTLMRPSLDEHLRARLAASGPVAPHAAGPAGQAAVPQPAAIAPSAADEDDDDDMQTLMRDAPLALTAFLQHQRAPLSPSPDAPPPPANFPGAPHPMAAGPVPAQPGAFPAPGPVAPGSAPGFGVQHGYGPPAAPNSAPGAPYPPPVPFAGPAMVRPPIVSVPAPGPSSAGVAIVVAILALIVAAGATFLYLRARAGSTSGVRESPPALSVAS